MDFSFEKTHSAYMLFYEHADMQSKSYSKEVAPILEMESKSLLSWIYEDNCAFLRDKVWFIYQSQNIDSIIEAQHAKVINGLD